jgi:hypothetical protein
MAIKSNTGPVNGRAVMQQALASRMRQTTRSITPLGGAPQTGSPVPVHHLPLTRLNDENALAATSVTSWLYPVIGGARPGLADVREIKGAQSPVFGGLSEGTLATRFMEACMLAEQALAGVEEELMPRLLDVPALQFAALWLHGSTSDYFISLLDGNPAGTAPLTIANDALPILRARASNRTTRSAVPPVGAGPTGTPSN